MKHKAFLKLKIGELYNDEGWDMVKVGWCFAKCAHADIAGNLFVMPFCLVHPVDGRSTRPDLAYLYEKKVPL